MALSKFKIKKGTNLEPQSSLSNSTTGDLEVSSSDGKLYYHDGDSSSSLVSADSVDTLTNKTINADSNTITNIDNNEIKALAGIDATKIADGSVSNTEFQYLDGASGNLQTQLNTNSSTISAHTGASSGVHGVSGSVVGTTDSQALTNKTINADSNTITNIDDNEIKAAAGINATKIADGSVDNTEFQYLDGASGNLQTQLNGKQSTGNYITALTSDVTASGPGSAAATIATNAVTDAKFRQSAALSLVGRSANSTGNVADISAASDNNVLRRSGTSIGFGSIDLAQSGTVGSSLLPLANGGTNKNMTAVAGGVVWTDSDSMEVSAAGTSGQALLSGGTGAPTWGNVLTNPMTSGGDLIVGGSAGVATRLANGTVNQYLASAGGTSVPVWTSFVAPTIQQFTTGGGTYTTPTSPRVPLYIRVRMVGEGGAGGGSGTSGTGGNGPAGNATTFGPMSAGGGGGGAGSGGAGGAGGTSTLGSGPVGIALDGGKGGGGTNTVTATGMAGGVGGASFFGGQAGNSRSNVAGQAGAANTGGGGAGGGTPATASLFTGAGGGGGGYIDAIIVCPTTSYSYSVPSTSSGGTAGTTGQAGGAGGSGYIIVTEYYQ